MRWRPGNQSIKWQIIWANSCEWLIAMLSNYFSLLKGLPNTYAYTKALTEDLVNSYSGKIPIVIARPSIGKWMRVFLFEKMDICLFAINFWCICRCSNRCLEGAIPRVGWGHEWTDRINDWRGQRLVIAQNKHRQSIFALRAQFN